MSILGTRVLRIEDPRFLTTGGVYTEDVVDDRLTGACHVFFVRSPIAHARIGGIDVSGALSAPGVIAAFTAADLADLPDIGPMMAGLTNERMRHRLLATDVVRYVGDAVAAVVTEEPYQGEDAMELVDVDYEPLPAVVDLAAAESDEVILFEEAGTNIAANKLHPSLDAGAVGAILAFACLAPTSCYEIYAAWKEGDAELARLKQDRIAASAQRVVGELGIPGVKYGMDFNGYFGGPARLPLLPLIGEVKKEVEQLLADIRN